MGGCRNLLTSPRVSASTAASCSALSDAEPGVHALEFGLANLLGLVLQRDDGRRDVDGAPALMEALDLSVDQCLGVAGLRLRSAMCEAATACRSSMS